MGQLTDFLMKDYEQTSVQREVMISPFPFPFVLRSITQEENKELEKSCEKKNSIQRLSRPRWKPTAACM